MRHLSTLALAGLFGGLLLVGDASACHKKKKCTCPAPVTYCAPAPVVVAPAPVAYCPPPVKKTCHFKMPKMGGHKKAAYCPPVYTTYATPTMITPTPQGSVQSM